jgi:hypothetical protein
MNTTKQLGQVKHVKFDLTDGFMKCNKFEIEYIKNDLGICYDYE